jgi:hypothetical protein
MHPVRASSAIKRAESVSERERFEQVRKISDVFRSFVERGVDSGRLSE